MATTTEIKDFDTSTGFSQVQAGAVAVVARGTTLVVAAGRLVPLQLNVQASRLVGLSNGSGNMEGQHSNGGHREGVEHHFEFGWYLRIDRLFGVRCSGLIV